MHTNLILSLYVHIYVHPMITHFIALQMPETAIQEAL